MSAFASPTVFQQAFRAMAGLLAPGAESPARPVDRWAGSRVTVLKRSDDAVLVRDGFGRTETLAASFGLAQTIDAAVAAHGLPADATGLVLEREMFCLEDVPFWRWTAAA